MAFLQDHAKIASLTQQTQMAAGDPRHVQKLIDKAGHLTELPLDQRLHALLRGTGSRTRLPPHNRQRVLNRCQGERSS